jgi:hypothetical protein
MSGCMGGSETLLTMFLSATAHRKTVPFSTSTKLATKVLQKFLDFTPTTQKIAADYALERWVRVFFPLEETNRPLVESFLERVDRQFWMQLQLLLCNKENNPRHYKRSKKNLSKWIRENIASADPEDELPTMLSALEIFSDDERYEIVENVFKTVDVSNSSQTGWHLRQEVPKFLGRQGGIEVIWAACSVSEAAAINLIQLKLPTQADIINSLATTDLTKSILRFIVRQPPAVRGEMIKEAYEKLPKTEHVMIDRGLTEYHSTMELVNRLWDKYQSTLQIDVDLLQAALEELSIDELPTDTILSALRKARTDFWKANFCKCYYELLMRPDRLGKKKAAKIIAELSDGDARWLQDILQFSKTEAKICVPLLLRWFKETTKRERAICECLKQFGDQNSIDEVKEILKKRIWDDIDGAERDLKPALQILEEEPEEQ